MDPLASHAQDQDQAATEHTRDQALLLQSRTAEGRARLPVAEILLRCESMGRIDSVAAQTLRNACAHLPHAQHLMQQRFLALVRRTLSAKHDGEGEGGEVAAAGASVLVNLCQLVANCAAHDDSALSLSLWTNAAATSSSTVGDLFRDMVAASARAKHRKAFAASLAAVYGTLCTPDASTDCLEYLCTSRQLWCQVLLTTVMATGEAEAEEQDPAWEWLLRILVKCCERGRLKRLFQLLRPRAQVDNVWDDDAVMLAAASRDAKSSSPFSSLALSPTQLTHEQVIFLHAIELALRAQDQLHSQSQSQSHSHGQSQSQGQGQGEGQGQGSGTSWDECLASLLAEGGDLFSLVHLLCNILSDGFPQATVDLDTDTEDMGLGLGGSPQLCLDLAESAHLAILSVVAAVLSHAVVLPGHALRSSLVLATAVVPSCVRLLQQPTASSSATTADGKPSASATGSSEAAKERVKSALALLGSLCYRCPEAQEAFLAHGGFAAVLPRCATRFDNPLEREWALVCVRNACEGCDANQRFVESLQPQGARVLDEKLGIEVELCPSTGTFKFRSARKDDEDGDDDDED